MNKMGEDVAHLMDFGLTKVFSRQASAETDHARIRSQAYAS